MSHRNRSWLRLSCFTSLAVSLCVAQPPSGTVRAWGLNLNGELGFATTTICITMQIFACSTVPGEVASFSGAVAVAAGGGHSLALKPDGTVWAWGINYEGELGNGSTSLINI